MKKKVFLLGISAFFVGLFTLWLFIIFPYPASSKKQLMVTKHDLIEGILKREVRLRELFFKENNKDFIQDKVFKEQIDEERKKFYKYCDNKGSLEYKGEYCDVTREMTLFDIDRYTTYHIKYKFDSQSKEFFNQVKIYMAHSKKYTNPTGMKKIWYDYFWRASKNDKLLYLTKIVGFEVQYSFFNNQERAEHHLLGDKIYELGSSSPVKKDDLISMESNVNFECSELITKKNCLVAFREIKIYVKKEKNNEI